jgi:hypothetical protein
VPLDWWGLGFNTLQVISILATAGFAAFGLFTKYKDDDGRITTAGRIAVVGIGLSALLSLGTQSVKAEVDRRKAKEADDKHQSELTEQVRHFNEQAAKLQRLDASQSIALKAAYRLQNRVETSLTDLNLLQDRVGQSIRAINTIGVKQDQYTARMLYTMWVDANRIGADSLKALVRYDCPRRAGTALPVLFRQDTVADINIKTSKAETYQLRSLSVTRAQMDPFGAHANQTNYVITFDRFFGSALEMLSDPDSWRGATIAFSILGSYPDSVSDLRAALSKETLGPDAVARNFNVVQLRDLVAVLPCPVDVDFFINDRFVVKVQGAYPALFRYGDRQRVMIKTEAKRVSEDGFPRFVTR